MKIEYKEDCCSFCDPKTRGKFTWIGFEDIGGYEGAEEEGYILDEDDCLYARSCDPYCGTGSLKINFCPVCGRSLKVVYKLNEMKDDFEEETDDENK